MNGLAVGSRWVVAAGADGYLKVLDSTRNDDGRVKMWGERKYPYVGVALDPSETLVASGLRSGRVQIQRLPDGDEVAVIEGAHRDGVEALEFSPDGRTLVTGSLDGSVRLWDRGPDGRWTGSLTLATSLGPVRRVRFNSDGRFLAVLVRNESRVHLWDLTLLKDRLSSNGFLSLPPRGASP